MASGPPHPRWASGLDAPGARRVRNLVGQELRARGIQSFDFVEDGVEWKDVDGWPTLAPLADLAYRCAAADPSSWSDLVEQGVATLLEVDRGDQPTLREGELTAEAVRALRPRPEPLIGEAPGMHRPRDPALEESAPPGGIRSPFARTKPAPSEEAPSEPEARALRPEAAPGPVPPPASPPGLVPPPASPPGPVPPPAFPPGPVPPPASPPGPPSSGARGWIEDEDDEPPAEPPSRTRKLWLAVAILAFGLTAALELRAFIVDPEAPDFFAGPRNDVLLEATPAGEVMVVAEADGRTLGPAPLRILVPPGPEVAVFLAAPGRTPKRVVLPSTGSVLERLDPRLPNEPTCTLRLPTAGAWQYQTVLGGKTSDQGEIELEGSAVVRVVPPGYGAWIVVCPKTGGTLELDLPRRFSDVHEVRALTPRGALLHLGGRPVGNIPVRWTQASPFAQLRVRSVTGEYLSRWLAVPGTTGVELPIDDSLAPPLSIPGTSLETPLPYYLRPRKKAPESELDAPLFDVDDEE